MSCSQPTNEDTKRRFFNCGSKINESMLWVFLFSYLYKNERKESSTPQKKFLMLEANKDYSKVIVESSSINWFKFYTIPTFVFNWELIVMALFRASLNNQ
jgi:hypothetical protein